ncbi:hypothetical protein BJ875DRAFT_262771 [Amylocarpus encephaloides]|uniref:ML-like domain-containing protein n=1 Tax=Amylocarpus encephaloides TaxID=45428 RepID=A0A9P7YSQ9_9HELO|nr:hypothetical protein BJ875DRAFT_262771 [Amylocarpus encephaloides]
MTNSRTRLLLLLFISLHSFFVVVCARDILSLSNFANCPSSEDLIVDHIVTQYDNSNRTVEFDISGTSLTAQNVTANFKVRAYGKDVYTKSFNPCDSTTFVAGLCPVPAGQFSAVRSETIPPEAASQIPDIAFSIPDIALTATLEIRQLDGGKVVGCVEADLSNGRTVNSKSLSYVAGGIVAVSIILSAATSLFTHSHDSHGSTGCSPNFTEMIGWFQTMASSGMLSVNYAPLYREFTERFAFSTGLISWHGMQTSIDNFRTHSGGNTTSLNTSLLKNSTLGARDIISTVSNSTANGTLSSNLQSNFGLQKYISQTGIVPQNAFMTVLLIACLVILCISLSILLFRALLELWALCGTFPKSLLGFRKRYLGVIFRTNVVLINACYGTWVLYCIFQFKAGDSWAATILAAVTLAAFTGVLIFFAVRIVVTARRHIKVEGNAARLFEDKKIWLKYSLFYDTYHRKSWWFFMTLISYNFVRYALIAGLDGRGLAQTVSILVCEVMMLILVCFVRPFERKRVNSVNILIQLVQVVRMGAILVFVDELKVKRSTQTVAGFALVIVSSVCTVLLVVLMVFNAVYSCCKDNPHRKKRKEAERQRTESEYFIDPKNPHAYRSSEVRIE